MRHLAGDGIHYNESNGRWTSANFSADSKYVMSPAANDDSDLTARKRWAQMVGHTGPIDWVVRKIGRERLCIGMRFAAEGQDGGRGSVRVRSDQVYRSDE